MSNDKSSYVYVALSVILWGTTAAVAKLMLKNLDNLQVLFISSIIAALSLLIIVIVQNKISIVSKIDSLYNYNENGQNFDYTFLEIGATGCITCKRMEIVLDEIRDKYPTKVNVVFINILIAKNQEIMKYYGVASIPTQILLDKSGKEFFRNSGYFSTLELSKHFNR